MKNCRSILKYCILFLVLLYSVSFIFWNRGTNDTYFWLHNFSQPMHNGLSNGTWIVGHIWCNLFGYTVLSYRILEWICCILAISIPYFIYYDKGRWNDTKPILSFSLAVFLMGYGTMVEFSPGTLSILLLSIIVSSILLLVRKKHICAIILSGSVSAISVFCRFPNIIAIVFVVAFIMINRNNVFFCKRIVAKWSQVLIYLFVFAFVYFLCYYISHRNIFMLNQTALAFSNTAVGEHEIPIMLKRMFNEANELILFASLTLFVSIFPIAYRNIKTKTILRYIIFIGGIICLLYVLRSNVGTHVRGNRQLHECISVLSIMAVLMRCYLLRTQKCFNEITFGIISILILCVVPIGSDTGWVKLFPALLILLPLTLPDIKRFWNNELAILMMLVVCAYSFVCFARNNISGITRDNICEMKEKTDVAVLKHILLSHHDIEVINTVCDNYLEYGEKDNTIFYGFNAHFFYEITACSPIYKDYSFWMHKNDTAEIDSIVSILKQYQSVLFDNEKNDSDYFINAMESIDYEMVYENDLYKVYKRKQDQS